MDIPERDPAYFDDVDTFDGHHDGSFDAASLQKLLLTTDTVEAFLDQLVAVAAKDTGHHCGITLGPRDARHDAYTVASSDPVTRQLDELQYADGQGPCLEALHTGQAVFVPDMVGEDRWPAYTPHAVALGARSSMSYPLQNEATVLGAINFYAFEPVQPGPEVQAHAAQLAANAAGAVALALRLAEREDMIENLRTALTSRSTIDQAIGILMAQQRCDARTAFDLLRKASQGRNIKLRDVANGITASVERDTPGATGGRY